MRNKTTQVYRPGAGLSWSRYRRLFWLALSLLAGAAGPAAAQVATDGFTASTGTFVPLVGGTVVPGVAADTYLSGSIALGFTFVFDGTPYTSVKASSDGYLTFNPAATLSTGANSLATTAAVNRPLIAPLWDDLAGHPSGATAVAAYQVSGAAPNRVFTFEWLNWQWGFTAPGAVISFQVKLHESTNQIEFLYRGETTPVEAGGASIGLAGTSAGSPDFLSLNATTATPTASATFETTTLASKPATGQVYSFVPAPVAACPAPRALAAFPANTSAVLSWSAAGGSGTFRVEYGLNGFTPGQGTTVATSGTSVTVAGLAANTAYQFYVTQLCGGSVTSPTSGPTPFTTRTAAAPANDDCAAARPLVPGSAPSCAGATSGTVEGANPTPNLPTPAGTADDDVWYQFTATASAHTVTLSGSGDYVQELLTGSCAALTSVDYARSNGKIYSGLTVGAVYYLRVYSFANYYPSSAAAAFSVCVTTPPPAPANDNPCGATNVPVVADCSAAVQSTTANATTTVPNGYLNPGCANATMPLDVWFKFVTDAAGPASTAVSVVVTGTPAGQVRVFSAASCAGPFTQLACQAGSASTAAGTLNLTGLAPATTYYVFVSAYSSAGATGPFTICLTPPPVCPAPTALAAPNRTPTSATLTWAVSGGSGSFVVSYGAPGFNPASSGHSVTASTTSVVLTDLMPDTPYEAYVTQSCGSGLSLLTGPLLFRTPALPPPNDECATATPVTVQYGPDCLERVVATNAGATASANVPAPGCANYAGGDVWFRVVVPASGTLTVSTDSVAGSPVEDTDLAIYSGTCGSLTLVGCNDLGGSNGLFAELTVTNRPPGEVLYLRLWEYGNDRFGPFKLCVRSTSSCPAPLNPAAAGITSTAATLSWSLGATPGPGATGTVEYGLQGFRVGSGTVIQHISGTSVGLNNLQPGSRYCAYITQDCGPGSVAPSGPSVPVGPVCFTTLPAAPANDEPCTATVLPLDGTVVQGTTLGATTSVPNGYLNPGCTTSNNPKDVWFTLTIPGGVAEPVPVVFDLTGSPAGQCRLFTAASCGIALSQVACKASAGSNQAVGTFTVELLSGHTYFLMVAGYGSNDAMGPFTLRAEPLVAATRAELPGGEVSVFPNPSLGGAVTLRLRGAGAVKMVQSTVLNGLGQELRQQAVPLQNGAAESLLPLAGLKAGIYTLRLQIGPYLLTRRLVLQ